jgi:hypothetical protein
LALVPETCAACYFVKKYRTSSKKRKLPWAENYFLADSLFVFAVNLIYYLKYVPVFRDVLAGASFICAPLYGFSIRINGNCPYIPAHPNENEIIILCRQTSRYMVIYIVKIELAVK